MKHIIITVLFLMCIFQNAVSQNWQWAKSAGGVNFDGGGAVRIDGNNDLYVVGSFESANCYFSTDTLHMIGDDDMFFAKYDNNGNELWVKRLGGNNPVDFTNMTSEGMSGFVYDSTTNSIYLSGNFYGSASFGTFNLLGSGNEIFLAKYDLNGNCIWAKRAGGLGIDRGGRICIDDSGNIYQTGSNENTATFNSVSIPAGGFLAKYDNNGNCLWAKKVFEKDFEASYVQISEMKMFSGDLLLTGGSANDTTVIDTATLISTNYNNLVLAVFDTSGTVKWAKLGGGSECLSFSMDIDNDHNIYMTGTFSGSIQFDSVSLSSPASNDLFFIKFDSTGSFKWVRQLDASLNATGSSLKKDGEGTIYITGKFAGKASFGAYNISSVSNPDMFLARYANNGDCIGVRHTGKATGWGLTTDGNGSVYVGGFIYNTVNFDSHQVTSRGDADIFIAKSDAITGIEVEGRMANNQLLIYANPNAGKCNITVPDDFLHEKNLTLSIYDNTGKLIQQKTLQMNDGIIKLNLEAEAKGTYSVILSNSSKAYNGKIVFE